MLRTLTMILAVTFLMPISAAWGHPPESVKLEFDITEHLLKIMAGHDVKNPTKHYVDRIVVQLNGEEIIQQTFKSQVDTEGQVVVYKIIDAKPGDEISVSARCNIAGRKKASIEVEEEAEVEEEEPVEEERPVEE